MATTAEPEMPQSPLISAEQAFDAIGAKYEDAFAGHPDQAESVQWLLSQMTNKPSKFVDVGCGTGNPVCSTIAAAGHDVLGIDISGEMIKACNERVASKYPNAKFEQLDIRSFNPAANSYDAASVYFSMIADVTQEEIRGFIAKIYGFLKPGGAFVFATVPLPAENMQIRWMAKDIIVSSLASEDAVEAFKKAGFEVESHKTMQFMPKGAEAGICKAEEVWEEPHLFIRAKKPTA